MIRLTGRLICADATERAVVLAHMEDHIRLTRAEPGCLSFDLRPGADPLIFEVTEAFSDRAAFEAHQSRTKASPWFAATASFRRDFHLDEGPSA